MFVVADDNNMELATNFINSVRKFHTEKELPIDIITGKELEEYRKDDPHFFYRATPIVAMKYMDEYETVIKADADQIMLGDIKHILSLRNYDVGTVLNYNRVDEKKFGLVTNWIIDPQAYYNCGFVAMKNKRFVEHWLKLCLSEHFEKIQYREQGLLNIMCHFGDYKVKCFDHKDVMHDYYAWHGLVCKGEGVHMVLKDGVVTLPKAEDGYPPEDIIIKIHHYAGGGHEVRTHRTWFNEDLIKHIDYLISDDKSKRI